MTKVQEAKVIKDFKTQYESLTPEKQIEFLEAIIMEAGKIPYIPLTSSRNTDTLKNQNKVGR